MKCHLQLTKIFNKLIYNKFIFVLKVFEKFFKVFEQQRPITHGILYEIATHIEYLKLKF